MDRLSIIVPAQNDETTIRTALRSAADSVAHLRGHPSYKNVRAEIIVVDDGSIDETLAAIVDCTRGNELFKVFHRDSTSSPGFARNSGVHASEGELLFFLDADDLYYENHLFVCCEGMKDPAIGLVKTGTALSDAVHADWQGRIGNSLVINLCVRRECHEFIGGFPDYHIYHRTMEGFEPFLDIFRMIEDVHYNSVLTRFFRQLSITSETVAYQRRPGNSFDRQFEKFQLPIGAVPDSYEDEFNLKVRLSKTLMEYHIAQLRKRAIAETASCVAKPTSCANVGSELAPAQ
jgi:glycosyltransferase involved in cell wall biosynthesis